MSAETALVVGFTLAGAVLRFATLSKQSFWLDEALAAREIHHSFGTMLSSIGHSEANPPLYFVVAWGWAKAFGFSEAGLRSLSAVAGTALIPLGYLCGRELVSRRAGALAAVLVAFSPFMIWYSQEAREYMLFAAFAGASLLFFARSWRTPSRGNLLGWAAFSALALLTNYFAVFALAPEAVLLLIRARNRWLWIGLAGLAVVGAALLPHLINNLGSPVGWIGSLPLSLRIKQLPTAFAIGNLYESSAVSYALIGAAALAAAVIALLVIGASGVQLRGAGLAAAIGGTVVLAPLLLGVVGHDYFVPRALIAGWLPLAVVVAAACTSAGWSRAPGAALAVITLAGFVYSWTVVQREPRYQRPDWRGVAAALGHGSAPRAVVAYDGGYAAEPIALYLKGQTFALGDPAAFRVDEIDVVGSPWQSTPTRLPGAARLLSSRQLGPYLVRRFRLAAPVQLTPAQIAARAGQLLVPATEDPAVVVQRSSA
ncbi:MAG: glycosyltransferase family 39 protein [Solirubrobacteraceae bacterium]